MKGIWRRALELSLERLPSVCILNGCVWTTINPVYTQSVITECWTSFFSSVSNSRDCCSLVKHDVFPFFSFIAVGFLFTTFYLSPFLNARVLFDMFLQDNGVRMDGSFRFTKVILVILRLKLTRR